MSSPVTDVTPPEPPQQIQIAFETIVRFMETLGSNYLESKMVHNGKAYYLAVQEGEL